MPESEPLDLRPNFSVDWLDYRTRYDSDMLAAVDIETGRRFT